jgi:Flp pilus assembly pilin Flp
MERIATHLSRFLADERGTTVIEYCLIAGLMSIAIVAGAKQIGQSIVGMLGQAEAGLR